jgi:hypothetical protein
MSRPCFSHFRAASREYFSTKEDAEEFFDDFVARAEKARRESTRVKNRADAYNMTVDELMSELERRDKLTRKQTYINLDKRIKAIEFVNSFPEGQRNKAVTAFLGGIQSARKGTRDSVVAAMKSHTSQGTGLFLSKLFKENVYVDFINRKNELNIGKAIFGEAVADSKFNKIAAAYNEANEYLVKRLNEEGADIVLLKEGRIAKNSHIAEMVRSPTGSKMKDIWLRSKLFAKLKKGSLVQKEMDEMAYKRWRAYIEPRTNLERTLERVPAENVERFWRGFWESVTSGEHGTPYKTGGHPFVVRSGANIGRKLSARRIWIPKDATSWVEYNRTYGMSTVQDAILHDFRANGENLGIMSKLGSNPQAFGESLIRRVAEENKMEADKEKWKTTSRRLLNSIIKHNNTPMDGLGGLIFRGMKNIIYASRLGNVLVASLPDVNNIALALKPYGQGLLEANKIALENFVKGMPKGEMRELAIKLGVYSDGMRGNMLSKFGDPNSRMGAFAKLMQITEKATLIDRWDNPQRVGFAATISNVLAKEVKKDFASISQSLRTNLLRYNIDEKIWKLIQEHKEYLGYYGTRKYLAPDIAWEMSDESLARIYYGNKTGKASQLRLTRARNEIFDTLRTFFVEETSYAKPIPDAVDRTILHGGTEANSLGGQIWRQITMFKSWPVSAIRRTWGRMLLGSGADNLYEALIGGKADYSAITKYILGYLPYEYMAMAAKAVGQGRQPPDLTDIDTWKKMMSGPMFLYGDFLADDFGRRNSFLRRVAGPSVTNTADLIALLYQTFEGKNVRNQWFNWGTRNLPLLNTYGFKLGMDRMLLDYLHEKVDPDFRYRQMRRASEQGRQLMWLGG